MIEEATVSRGGSRGDQIRQQWSEVMMVIEIGGDLRKQQWQQVVIREGSSKWRMWW